MKRIFQFFIIVGLVLLTNQSLFANYIYQENEELIYIGGYSFNLIQFNVDRQPNLYLKNRLYSVGLNKNHNISILYQTKDAIKSYEICNDKYIAIAVGDLNDNESKYHSRLHIVAADRTLKKTLDNCIALSKGKFFCSSKSGNRIAYIAGETIIEGRTPFKSNGVWLYDIVSDSLKQISETGVRLNWSWHDGNIYIENSFDDPSKISFYNPSTEKLLPSDKKGIVFSDDGKYYIAKELARNDYPEEKYFLYDNTNNKPYYKFSGNEGFGLPQALNYQFVRNTHYLLVTDLWGYKVFDVDEKKMIKKSNNQIVGWNKDMTKVVVYEGGGKQVHIDTLLSGKRIVSVDIPTP